MRLTVLFTLIFLLNLPAFSEGAKPVISWQSPDQPPTSINDGPFAGKGFADKTTQFFVKQLPEFRHEFFHVNFSRLMSDLAATDGVCVAALFRTPEREKFVAFSHPVFFTLPNRVLVRRDKMNQIMSYTNRSGAVLLAKLLQAQNLIYGMSAKRSYGRSIDATIEEFGGQENLVVIPNMGVGPLLQHGRIDYSFGFAYEVAYQYKLGGAPNNIVTLPIEGEPKAVESAMACSDGPIGRAAIKRINQIIVAEGKRPEYFAYYEEWLDDSALSDFRDYVDNYELGSQ